MSCKRCLPFTHLYRKVFNRLSISFHGGLQLRGYKLAIIKGHLGFAFAFHQHFALARGSEANMPQETSNLRRFNFTFKTISFEISHMRSISAFGCCQLAYYSCVVSIISGLDREFACWYIHLCLCGAVSSRCVSQKSSEFSPRSLTKTMHW